MTDNTFPTIQDLMSKKGNSDDTDGQTHNPHTTATSQKLDYKLKDVHIKEKEEETQELANSSGSQYVNLKGFPIAPEALIQIPKDRAEKLKTVCFLSSGPKIRLGSTQPQNDEVKELLFQLEERNKAQGDIYLISEESLRVSLKAYDNLPQIREIVKGVKITKEELEKYQKDLKTFEDIQKSISQVSVSEVMTVVMAAAVQFNTSDVHIEAEQQKIIVRFRIDGVLEEVASLPHDSWKKIISRVKLISGLKINVTDRPQDGRFTIFLKEGDTDVRVSTIPTAWGESVVMRILKPSAIRVSFFDLGWRPPVEERLRHEISRPNGMLLTTGPTGSGKTTTLYGVLQELNKPEVKILTLEDPIEYKLEGINQSQIDSSKDYTFAGGLRSILRQDPDIVMVGEIRDLETAQTAIDAALTGHLLLSTLHTNNASGAIPRLISIGVNAVLLGPSLNGIIAQRLVRRVCQDCKEEQKIEQDILEKVKTILADIPENSGETLTPESEWKFYKGKGCDLCHGSGYNGRIGIYELLLMNKDIMEALKDPKRLSENDMLELGKKQGMVTMQQDGLLKVIDGVTTTEEVFRVTGE
ncbi:MAG: GspE/PulE family protein [Patescibacteria group bacterium]